MEKQNCSMKQRFVCQSQVCQILSVWPWARQFIHFGFQLFKHFSSKNVQTCLYIRINQRLKKKKSYAIHPIGIGICTTRNMYRKVHSNTICINSKLETIQMPIKSRMNKEILIYWQLNTMEERSANFFYVRCQIVNVFNFEAKQSLRQLNSGIVVWK